MNEWKEKYEQIFADLIEKNICCFCDKTGEILLAARHDAVLFLELKSVETTLLFLQEIWSWNHQLSKHSSLEIQWFYHQSIPLFSSADQVELE